jgi:hypothetical protein
MALLDSAGGSFGVTDVNESAPPVVVRGASAERAG